MDQFEDNQELAQVVAGFESCSIPADKFTHAQHLVVAVWYVSHYGEVDALDRMRSGLLRFLTHHGKGTQKYNETTTLFWLKKVQKYLAERTSSELSLVETTNAVILAYPRSGLIFDHFSEEVLQSETARLKWVDPDLKAL